jgi:hypothetical protein
MIKRYKRCRNDREQSIVLQQATLHAGAGAQAGLRTLPLRAAALHPRATRSALATFAIHARAAVDRVQREDTLRRIGRALEAPPLVFAAVAARCTHASVSSVRDRTRCTARTDPLDLAFASRRLAVFVRRLGRECRRSSGALALAWRLVGNETIRRGGRGGRRRNGRRLLGGDVLRYARGGRGGDRRSRHRGRHVRCTGPRIQARRVGVGPGIGRNSLDGRGHVVARPSGGRVQHRRRHHHTRHLAWARTIGRLRDPRCVSRRERRNSVV